MNVIDLDEETHIYEVSVWCYGSGDKCEDATYSVDQERGHGRLTIYETTSKDKALGVAEYLEQERRIAPDGTERDGEKFSGQIMHWHQS
jgi:hypothetical protein